jgi:hypothetical protein
MKVRVFKWNIHKQTFELTREIDLNGKMFVSVTDYDIAPAIICNVSVFRTSVNIFTREAD